MRKIWMGVFVFAWTAGILPAPQQSGQKAATQAQGILQEAGFQLPKRRLPAPAFVLSDIHGRKHSIASYKGKLILLHFWATWCKPCLRELPLLEGLHRKYQKSGLVILAVNVDRSHPDRVQSLARRLSLSLPILLDPEGHVRRAYEAEAFPTSYVIGKDGLFLGKLVGESLWGEGPFKKLLGLP